MTSATGGAGAPPPTPPPAALPMGIQDAADYLGVPVRCMRAVVRVEVGTIDPSKWLRPDGRPVYRVEAHHVLRRCGRAMRGASGLRVRAPDRSWYGGPGEPTTPWVGHEVLVDGAWLPYHHPDRDPPRHWCEDDAMDAAIGLLRISGGGADPRAVAMECSSWGPGQVMGAHWDVLGYDSVYAFEAASRGLGPMVRYIAQAKLHTAIAEQRWMDFAGKYNGPGNARDYAKKMTDAYALG